MLHTDTYLQRRCSTQLTTCLEQNKQEITRNIPIFLRLVVFRVYAQDVYILKIKKIHINVTWLSQGGDEFHVANYTAMSHKMLGQETSVAHAELQHTVQMMYFVSLITKLGCGLFETQLKCMLTLRLQAMV